MLVRMWSLCLMPVVIPWVQVKLGPRGKSYRQLHGRLKLLLSMLTC